MNTTNSMISFRHEIGLRFLKFVNILYMVIPFAIAWMIYYDHMTAVQYYWKGDIAIIGIYFLLYCYFGKTYDAFLISHYRIFDIVASQTLSVFLCDCAFYVGIFVLAKGFVNPIPLLVLFVDQIALSIIWTS